MALFGISLWLFLLVFVIAMILVGVLLWYLEKLIWYLIGRRQESEFDKVKETEVLIGGLETLISPTSPCQLIGSASLSGLLLAGCSRLRP